MSVGAPIYGEGRVQGWGLGEDPQVNKFQQV